MNMTSAERLENSRMRMENQNIPIKARSIIIQLWWEAVMNQLIQSASREAPLETLRSIKRRWCHGRCLFCVWWVHQRRCNFFFFAVRLLSCCSTPHKYSNHFSISWLVRWTMKDDSTEWKQKKEEIFYMNGCWWWCWMPMQWIVKDSWGFPVASSCRGEDKGCGFMRVRLGD